MISDPHATESLYRNIVNEAREEILLILPTVNAFAIQKKLGILDLLKKQQSEKGVKVRILVPVKKDETNEPDISDLEAHGVHVNQLSFKPPQKAEEGERTRVTTVIADTRTSLIVEQRNDEKKDFADAIGTAVLSTGKALASSYARIFESLWLETELTAKLLESDKMQKEFINIAAHELRTPITPILVALYLAENAKESKEASRIVLTKEQSEMIQRNAKRLERLATDILMVSRIDIRGVKLAKEAGDLGEWIKEEVVAAEMAVPDGKTTDVVFVPPKEPLIVNADRSRVFEVLSNLVRNAIRFSPKGGRITVTATKADGAAIVQVIDEGRGIDPGVYPRLFQKFAASQELGATGLGLYISRLIVEAHGGRIWANKGKKGATFAFSLPLAHK